MITFSKLGKKGNIGNQLFQIASTIGISVKNNSNFIFPKWIFSEYFENELPTFSEINIKEFLRYNERQFNFNEIILNNSENYDLEGWFQSEKYFEVDLVKNYLKFKDDHILRIKKKYFYQFQKKTILISIRRGDFVNHRDYYQLPINYYIIALVKYFPDWESNFNIFVFSDDINYSKFHFSDFKNITFNEGMSVIDQLIISTLCDNFIISNSTFSWWCAWLGEKDKSIIIRPKSNFSEEKKFTHNDSDYFPERWTKFNHELVKLKLNVKTFNFHSNNSFLKNYYYAYFDICMSNENKLNINILNCIIPPLYLYNIIEKNIDCMIFYKNNVYISRLTEIKFLNRLYDFGIFSKIFKFNNKTIIGKALEIYVELNSNMKTDEINLVGKINFFLGNNYLMKVLILKITIFIKSKLKKLYLFLSKII